jgi:N-methylhydantoinase A
VQQGFDPRDFALVAFGGAGPLHANALGKLTGAWPVIVPPSPGVLCALGDATTSARSESARTVLNRFADLDAEDLRRILDELAAEAGGRLAEQGVPVEQQTTAFQVDVRYHGQGFEIPVDVDQPDLAAIANAFDVEHQRLFSFLLTVDHELVNARATVTGPRPSVTPVTLESSDGPPEPPDGGPYAWSEADGDLGCSGDRVVDGAVACRGQKTLASLGRELQRDADLEVDQRHAGGPGRHRVRRLDPEP